MLSISDLAGLVRLQVELLVKFCLTVIFKCYESFPFWSDVDSVIKIASSSMELVIVGDTFL